MVAARRTMFSGPVKLWADRTQWWIALIDGVRFKLPATGEDAGKNYAKLDMLVKEGRKHYAARGRVPHPRQGMVTVTVKPGTTWRGVKYVQSAGYDVSPEYAKHLVEQGIVFDFCRQCGAGVPPKPGEGTSPCCNPALKP